MAVTVSLLPDGSVALTDNGTTYPPLSPEAVQAVAGLADASAGAHKTQAMTETLTGLARLITAAGPIAGDAAYAQVTVTPGHAAAVLDEASFDLICKAMPGTRDGLGGWVVGQLTVSPKVPDPAPTPAPVPTPSPDPTPTGDNK